MAGNFSIIAYTPEIPRNDEAEWIEFLLTHPSCVISRVHIRHPDFDILPIIKSLPEVLLADISIHDQPELLAAYPALGFHFNSRNPYSQLPGQGLRSQSCHSVKELHALPKLDYVTLSPVFDSISKIGYKGNRKLLTAVWPGTIPVYALGGVKTQNIGLLKRFTGAAMLGSLNKPISQLPEVIDEIKYYVENLCSSL